ncbi:MAG: hypothetical protein COA45_01165 [Zetaproteobacteria bacterium]|nr:MAG: hypothetical protein COA45_01165 [Zetaproteobacteria bacterium]
MQSQYDDDKWLASQVRLTQQELVNGFRYQLDKLPLNDVRCAFLMSQDLYRRDNEETLGSLDKFNVVSDTIDKACRGAGLEHVSKTKFGHHFARAMFGGPEGMFHAEDLGVGAHNIEKMMAEHKKPDGVSQKAYDNSKKLGDLAKNVEEATRDNDLDGGLVCVFGKKWLRFKANYAPDNDWGHDDV